MSYNFQILKKIFLGHAKSWSWGREFEKTLKFFFNSSRAVLFSEGQKNICWGSLDVKFHKFSNCFFLKCPISFFHRDIVVQSQQWFLIAMTSTVRTISDGSVQLCSILFPTILRSWDLVFCFLLWKGKNQAFISSISEGSIGSRYVFTRPKKWSKTRFLRHLTPFFSKTRANSLLPCPDSDST